MKKKNKNKQTKQNNTHTKKKEKKRKRDHVRVTRETRMEEDAASGAFTIMGNGRRRLRPVVCNAVSILTVSVCVSVHHIIETTHTFRH